jgi:hypothetical protein
MMAKEFEKVWRYRNENQEDVSNYLRDVDEVTRRRLIELRSRVQETLEQFRESTKKG